MKKSKRFPVRAIKNMPRRISKWIYQSFLVSENGSSRRLVFVLGCQRSGTTMLERAFEKDIRTKMYGHLDLVDVNPDPDSLVYADAHGPRLKPYEEIREIIANDKAPILVKKSLREGQHTHELLRYFPEARVIWMYRNYKDVVNSHLVKWDHGVGIRKLRPIFDEDEGNHWASENIPESTTEIVKRYFSEQMAPSDAVALYWYARNKLFFDLELDRHPKVFLCRYEDIVSTPGKVMKSIYKFLDYKYPGDHLVSHIHTKSINRGKDTAINQEIEALCRALLKKLNDQDALAAEPYALASK